MPSLFAPLLLPMLICLSPGQHWQNIPANCKQIELPTLLKRQCYDFSIDFEAKVSGGKFIEIKNVVAPKPIDAKEWAIAQLSKVQLSGVSEGHSGRFRLKLKYSSAPKIFHKGPFGAP